MSRPLQNYTLKNK